ncbi:c-type cytochrome [Rhodocytophaga aerolata]|uniref:C-type cytochrome n=1 Tax=Rhodocytophaga aerolata TaxID=455078 RepID=A0ABT8R2E2_9BACT|nr:cbb3-type cytochrome c oxidase N-terminal domain-containing protein [Rhodocytophaga aerolata]MDO1445408.1 c-type cytochrome [Rhodocytophaga aerolata]
MTTKCLKSNWKAVGLAALATCLHGNLFAQGSASSTQTGVSEQEILFLVVSGMLIFVSIAVLVVALYILQVMRIIMQKDTVTAPVEVIATESFWLTFKKKFITGDVLPVEQEGAVAMDHIYDGIQELDNHMPPWLKYTFYGTIAFAIIYCINFFSLGLVQTSEQEYVAEMAQAEKEVGEFRKLAAASIDENSAKQVTDEAALTSAKAIYSQNCSACHGAAGEGGVGPNLTDEYWIHGGSVKDVFKTIKYGIPQKGMIAWQQKLKPDEIQNVSSYILSLQGTKPANGKEPQGDRVVSAETTPESKTMSSL